MELSDVTRAIDAIPAAERWGTLRFFGEWFGDRPYDNQHTLTEVRHDDQAIVLTFDEGETLTVWDPARVSVADDGLHIAGASRIKWEWFYYGRPRTPENRYSLEYRVDTNGAITVSETADWYEPRHTPDASEDAVGFLKPLVHPDG